MSAITTTIRVDSELKKEVSALAKNMGLTLNIVVNNYLRQFVQEKTITFSDPSLTTLTHYVSSGAYEEDDVETFDSMEDLVGNLHNHAAGNETA